MRKTGSRASNVGSLIDFVSPNAEEALSLFSQTLPPTKQAIESAAAKLISLGSSSVIIRCGEMGAFVLTGEGGELWFDAYWRDAADHHRVVDVTGSFPQLCRHRYQSHAPKGAGNAFLGGLAAGLLPTKGDVFQGTSAYSKPWHLPSLLYHLLVALSSTATLYGLVSASFVIEQTGLPALSTQCHKECEVELWNKDSPKRRLEELRVRCGHEPSDG